MNKAEIVEVTRVCGQQVEIAFSRQAMCDCCNLSAVCGKAEQRLLIDRNDFPLVAGDKIEIFIEAKKTLLAGVLTFLLPAFLFVLALISLQTYGNMPSFLLAIGILCVYYGVLKLLLRSRRLRTSFHIKIIRKVEEPYS